ncbi:MAG: alanine racemase C-terminal domain-containing protein [Ruthenibacterium lactatiformans]|uniref:alanine racemase C-terminal domain-containing protein n=1 Tax=Ruthenibacterium lactatiformans TaxID=1550024 RepID=UPI003993FBD7
MLTASSAFSNRFQVLTADGPALVLGRICMDMCMIDLTGCPMWGWGMKSKFWCAQFSKCHGAHGGNDPL